MDNFLTNLTPYLPFAVLGFLAAAGVLIVSIVSSYTRKFRNDKALKKALGQPLDYLQKMSPKKEKTLKKRAKYVWEGIKHFLSYLGVQNTDEAQSKIFLRAVKILRSHFGPKAQYKLPWYLVLGAKNSGKSTLIQSLDLDLPIGKPIFEEDIENPPLKWWFFDQGVVIDVSGDYFVGDGDKTEELGWKKLLLNLQQYRRRRPIDGITLAISCEDLIGKNAFSHDEVVQKAKHINTKLWHLQNSLSMRVPVYVVVTKTDAVPGFKGFAQGLPSDKLSQILGWSSPYGLETGYNAQWVEDLFATLEKNLHDVRAELYVAEDAEVVDNSAFVFKVEFLKLKEKLALYLNQIFKESTYHDSFFLRGVYFSGDTAGHTAVGDLRREDKYWVPPEALGYAVETPFQDQDQRQVSFIQDLFSKKIFREFTLSHPVKRALISTNKLVLTMQVVFLLFLSTWGVGLFLAYTPLQKAAESMKPVLQQTDQTIDRILFKNFNPSNAGDILYLRDQTEKILTLMENVNAQDVRSAFVPASWFGSLDRKVQAALTQAWDHVILNFFYVSLTQKANALFLPIQHKGTPVQAVNINPVNSPEFKNFDKFVKDVVLFERAVQKFNTLEKTQNLDDVGYLARYLLNKELANRFYEQATLYRQALKNTLEKNINLTDFEDVAQKKLDVLGSDFKKAAFAVDRTIGNIDDLRLELQQLNASGQMGKTAENYMRQTHVIMDVEKRLNDAAFGWVEKKTFDPDPVFGDLLNHIANSRLFGIEKANTLTKTLNQKLGAYQEDLSGIFLPTIGRLVAVKAQTGTLKAEPSPNYKRFVDKFRKYLGQSFMLPVKEVRKLQRVPEDQFILWDKNVLDQAAKMIETYEDYIINKTVDLPDNQRLILEQTGRKSIRLHIFNALAQAQSFRLNEADQTAAERQDSLYTQVKNLKSVYPDLRKMLDRGYMVGAGEAQAEHVRQVLVTSCMHLLRALDTLLDEDKLYKINKEAFKLWNGRDMLGLAAFGAMDLDDVKKILATQRKQVALLTKEFARPILNVLDLKFLASVPKDEALVSKWRMLVKQIGEYEKGQTNSSLARLERFIKFDLNRITGTTCLSLVDSNPQSGFSKDFFLETRNQLRNQVVDQCRSIIKRKAKKNYLALYNFFNNYISGLFPFTSDPSRVSGRDANPEDLKTLIQLYELLTPGEKKAISLFFSNPGYQDTPAAFVRKIGAVIPFLKAAINYSPNPQVASPRIYFDAAFDAHSSSETGKQYIIGRSINIDHKSISQKGKSKTGSWRVGDDVKVIFKWVQGSNNNRFPVKDRDQQFLEVTGKDATFHFKGRWSFLKLLRTYAQDLSANDPSRPITLKFEIPTRVRQRNAQGQPVSQGFGLNRGKASYAELFIDLYMSTAAGDPKQKKPIAFPVFPYKAPSLSDFEKNNPDQNKKSTWLARNAR